MFENKIEMPEVENPMENTEIKPEAGELNEAQEPVEGKEPSEAKEANEGKEIGEPTDEGAKETLGYSSDYYKHQMASDIKNGNRTAYEHDKKHYSEKLVKESTK